MSNLENEGSAHLEGQTAPEILSERDKAMQILESVVGSKALQRTKKQTKTFRLVYLA